MKQKKILSKLFKMKSVLIPFCLAIFLSSCSQSVVTKVEKVRVPIAYLVECKQTVFNGKTYGDVIRFLITVIEERDICAKQINLIKEWQGESE
ncbi:Rz1-like lysis system protein LysC [Phocoenobacter skyensis]|uniref:Rz1-like lysis system protein LysC n=2 Tax=Phocoenobacter skyensis TaxID=97481 RepID=UPI003CCE72EB